MFNSIEAVSLNLLALYGSVSKNYQETEEHDEDILKFISGLIYIEKDLKKGRAEKEQIELAIRLGKMGIICLNDAIDGIWENGSDEENAIYGFIAQMCALVLRLDNHRVKDDAIIEIIMKNRTSILKGIDSVIRRGTKNNKYVDNWDRRVLSFLSNADNMNLIASYKEFEA